MDFGSPRSPISESNHPSGIEALRFAGERESPLRSGIRRALASGGEIADAPDAERVEILLHHLPDAGHLSYFKWG